jgi:hypothetical protein
VTRERLRGSTEVTFAWPSVMSLDSLAVATVNEHAQIEALEPESVLVKARVEGWVIGLTGPDYTQRSGEGLLGLSSPCQLKRVLTKVGKPLTATGCYECGEIIFIFICFLHSFGISPKTQVRRTDAWRCVYRIGCVGCCTWSAREQTRTGWPWMATVTATAN